MAVAIGRALEKRLRGISRPTQRAALLKDLAAIRRRWSALPIRDPRSSDENIGYDENGLPR